MGRTASSRGRSLLTRCVARRNLGPTARGQCDPWGRTSGGRDGSDVPELRTDFSGQLPDTYDQLLVPMLFAPYAEVLGARIADLVPARVLEVAAGSGALTRELAARLPNAAITATDLAQPMLDRAAALGPDRVRWQQADAQDLPVPDAAFDVWACQFGIMFVPDRVRAYREAHRALAPGGHLVLATWTGLAGNGFADALDAALRARFPDDPPGFVRAVPHGYTDPDLVCRELTAAGFADPQVDVVVLESVAASAEDVATAFLLGTPVGHVVRDRGPGEPEATTAHVEAAVRARFGAGPVRAPMTALVVTARR